MRRIQKLGITTGSYPAIARIGFQIGPRIAWRLARDSSGIAAIEYALIASLIAVGIVVSVTSLGTEVSNHWDGVAQSVEGG